MTRKAYALITVPAELSSEHRNDVSPSRGMGGGRTPRDVDGVISPATATVAAIQTALALRMLVGWPNFRPFVQPMDLWKADSAE